MHMHIMLRLISSIDLRTCDVAFGKMVCRGRRGLDGGRKHQKGPKILHDTKKSISMREQDELELEPALLCSSSESVESSSSFDCVTETFLSQ